MSSGVTKKKSKGYAATKGLPGTKGSTTRAAYQAQLQNLNTYAISKNGWTAFYKSDRGQKRLQRKKNLAQAKIDRYRHILSNATDWTSDKAIYESWVAGRGDVVPRPTKAAEAMNVEIPLVAPPAPSFGAGVPRAYTPEALDQLTAVLGDRVSSAQTVYYNGQAFTQALDRNGNALFEYPFGMI